MKYGPKQYLVTIVQRVDIDVSETHQLVDEHQFKDTPENNWYDITAGSRSVNGHVQLRYHKLINNNINFEERTTIHDPKYGEIKQYLGMVKLIEEDNSNLRNVTITSDVNQTFRPVTTKRNDSSSDEPQKLHFVGTKKEADSLLQHFVPEFIPIFLYEYPKNKQSFNDKQYRLGYDLSACISNDTTTSAFVEACLDTFTSSSVANYVNNASNYRSLRPIFAPTHMGPFADYKFNVPAYNPNKTLYETLFKFQSELDDPSCNVISTGDHSGFQQDSKLWLKGEFVDKHCAKGQISSKWVPYNADPREETQFKFLAYKGYAPQLLLETIVDSNLTIRLTYLPSYSCNAPRTTRISIRF